MLTGLYYGVTISLVSFATGLSVVTLNIHHRGMRGRAVPPLVKRIVFGILAKILFIQLDIPEDCSAFSKQKVLDLVAYLLPFIIKKSTQSCPIFLIVCKPTGTFCSLVFYHSFRLTRMLNLIQISFNVSIYGASVWFVQLLGFLDVRSVTLFSFKYVKSI